MQTTSQPAASPAHLAHPAAHAVTWAEMAPHRNYLGADNSAKARALLAALEAGFAPQRVEHHEVLRGAVA